MLAITVGRRIYTWRYTGVTTSGTDITIPTDIPDVMEVWVHTEGSTTMCKYLGETHSGTADYVRTLDGVTDIFPLAFPPGEVVCKVKSPTGTINVSVMAFARL